MSDLFATSLVVRAIGVALVEFVWQGAVIAAAVAVALRVLRGSDPTVRYITACLGLVALGLAPIATAWVAFDAASAAAPAVALPAGGGMAVAATVATSFTTTITRVEWMPVIVFVWSLGVLLGGTQLALGWLSVARLRRRSRPLSGAMQQHLAGIGRRLGLSRRVRIAESRRVTVPTVLGWVKPLILVPSTTLTGLTVAELETILAHELAHVRRHDYLVNLFQSGLETVLFYHPAVWWLSRRVRAERELCCDDLAVSVCGDRLVYARALARLENYRFEQTQTLAVAATGGDLLNRVRRLIGVAPAEQSRTSLGGIMAVLVAVPLLVASQAVTSARTSVQRHDVSLAALPQPAPIVVGPSRTPDAAFSADDWRMLERDYAALVRTYRSRTSAQQASSGAVQAPAAPPSVAEQVAALLAEMQRQIDARNFTEASRLLKELTPLVSQLPAPPPPPPAAPVQPGLPPPPPAPPVEMATSVYPAPVRVGGAVAVPTKIKDVSPVYPQEARDAQVQGLVIIEAIIDAGGNVVDVKILRGHPMLNQAAIDAVSQWKYTRPTLEGQPVSVVMTVTVNFSLN